MKEKIQQKLMNGLTRKQASSFASLLVELAEDSKNIVLVAPRQVGRIQMALTVQDRQLAETLSVKLNQFIDTTGYNYKKPTVDELAKAISALQRLDGKSYKEISALITYLYTQYEPNSSFDWRMQVRSGAAFRKHYEKIMISANQDFNFRKSRHIEDV